MQDYRYSAVVPSRDFETAKFCIGYLIDNSDNLGEVILFWNGKKELELEVRNWMYSLSEQTDIKLTFLTGYTLDVYEMYNEGVKYALNEYVLLINDDMYVPPFWDKELPILCNQPFQPDSTIITFMLVEPGYVDVNYKCIKKDFGQTLETFDKVGFDAFAEESQHILGDGLGWYMPVIFPKNLFIMSGCYPTNQKFPYPNDISFFEKLKTRMGISFLKIHSLVYHFQRLSQRPKNSPFEKLNLCCGNDVRDGYVNADVFDSPMVVKIDLEKEQFPFTEEHFSEVLFNHALEHFRQQKGIEVLREILRVLKVDGFLEVGVPNLKLACEDFLAGFNSFDNIAPAIQRIYGLGVSEHQIHKFGYTEEMLYDALFEAGFKKIEVQKPLYADEIRMRAWK
jgi:predicted SAM-dependent methyltransferase